MSNWPYIESLLRFISKRQSNNDILEIVEDVGLDYGLIDPGDSIPPDVISGYKELISSLVQEAESQDIEPSEIVDSVFGSRQSKFYVREENGGYAVYDEHGEKRHKGTYDNEEDAKKYQRALYVNSPDV